MSKSSRLPLHQRKPVSSVAKRNFLDLAWALSCHGMINYYYYYFWYAHKIWYTLGLSLCYYQGTHVFRVDQMCYLPQGHVRADDLWSAIWYKLHQTDGSITALLLNLICLWGLYTFTSWWTFRPLLCAFCGCFVREQAKHLETNVKKILYIKEASVLDNKKINRISNKRDYIFLGAICFLLKLLIVELNFKKFLIFQLI